MNPNAQPFVLTLETDAVAPPPQPPAQEDRNRRSLFMTFFAGVAPLKWWEISDYFNGEYGDVVEHVYVCRQQPNRNPDYGKITFKYSDFPRYIMGNEEVVRMRIRGRDVWFKPYVPQNLRHQHQHQQ